MPFNIDTIADIVNEARKHSFESPWYEFKHNKFIPEEIGEYVSALSNTAALFNQEHAFMIWGVDDATHDVVGTSFDPQAAKIGGQALDIWIATQLKPQVQFYFYKTEIEEQTENPDIFAIKAYDAMRPSEHKMASAKASGNECSSCNCPGQLSQKQSIFIHRIQRY